MAHSKKDRKRAWMKPQSVLEPKHNLQIIEASSSVTLSSGRHQVTRSWKVA